MQTPSNPFKQALLARRAQIGLWLGLASPYSAEICAGAGFDWLLVDGEHSPNTVDGLLRQLQVIAAYPQSHPIVRVPVGLGHAGTTVIKQVLDIGAQTLLVPMIDTAEQAAEVVRATRYAPQGIRGMAGARASRWGRYPNYPQEANAHICVLVQAESGEALENLEAICAVEGVDGVFIGPADLSASLGYVGQSTHPDMLALMEKAIARIQAAGKAAGILTPDEAQAKRYLELGATFVAVGLDTQILVRQTSALAARFKSDVSTVRAGQAY